MAFEITDHLMVRHRKGGNELNYQLSDKDETTSTRYYLYVSNEGSWMIMEDTDTTTRYLFGWSDIETAWTGRAGHTYKRWDLAWQGYDPL